jgi:NAD-specific glutamate dehydrogenase
MNLRAAFLRRHSQIYRRQFNRGACTHEALEERSCVLGIARSVIVSAFADVFVSTLVDKDSGRRYVVLIGALEQSHALAVVCAYGTIGSSQIDADVVRHCGLTFASTTVPPRTKPSGRKVKKPERSRISRLSTARMGFR